MKAHHFIWELLKRTVREFQDDDCLHMAAGVAYYALFSLFPLVLGLISVLGIVLEPREVQDRLTALVAGYLPGSGEFVASTIADVVSGRGALGVLAVVGLFWSGSAVFAAIRRSINRAWDIEQQRPFLKQKLVELLMMVGVGMLFLISLSSTVALQVLDDLSGGLLRAGAGRTVLLSALSFFTIFLIVLLIYRYLPNTTVRWADVWLGALVVAVLFEAGKRGFVWYLETRALQSYSLTYGPLTAVIVLLLWTYLSAVVLLAGAELASEYTRLRNQLRGEREPRHADQVNAIHARRAQYVSPNGGQR